MRVIRVVVADDDAAFRDALVDVVDADARFQVVASASTGEDIVGLVSGARADLVLLDVRMPGGGAIAARAIREAVESSDLRAPAVVALSAQSAVHTVVAMVREGAVGYLVKGRLGSALPDLLFRCAAGEVVLAVPSGGDALRQLSRAGS